MSEDKSTSSVVNPLRLVLWGMVIAILLAPLVAMQFTSEVNWSVADFFFAAFMLIGAGVLLEFVLLKVKSRAGKITACLVVIGCFLLGWAIGAVGI